MPPLQPAQRPELSGVDPVSGAVVRLFDPRREKWADHFHVRGPLIEGRTPTGRATAAVLAFNHPVRVELRRLAEWRGVSEEWP